jgi:hypothetical protein
MVLVGHSMGGLLTRLMITDSADHFDEGKESWKALSEGDLELQQYGLSLSTFEPLPFVRRAVFMGAPHKGASLAERSAGRIGSGIVSHPEYMRAFLSAKEGRMERLSRMQNGVDNLATDSPFTLALQKTTWPSSTTVHSVIGDFLGAGRINGTDTVVSYRSAHIEGVESELVVHADHLTLHKKMPAIAEVRRILLEHLGE